MSMWVQQFKFYFGTFSFSLFCCKISLLLAENGENGFMGFRFHRFMVSHVSLLHGFTGFVVLWFYRFCHFIGFQVS